MADIKNRAAWNVVCNGTGAVLGTYAVKKTAESFALIQRASGTPCKLKQLDTGPWQVRIRRAGFPCLTETFERQKDAKAWATLREAEYLKRELQDYREADRTSLADLLLRYRNTLTKDALSDNSKWHRLGKLARDSVAQYRLSALKPPHISEYRDRRLKEVKPATVLAEINLISFVIPDGHPNSPGYGHFKLPHLN